MDASARPPRARKPRAPRHVPPASENPSLEALMREMSARFEGLELRVTETREDAREARDAATRLTERLGAQDTPAQLAEIRGEMKAGFQAARADLVNSIDKLAREHRDKGSEIDTRFKAMETRLAAVEAWKQRLEGAGGLFAWISKNAPWLIALAVTGLAIGFKEKLP